MRNCKLSGAPNARDLGGLKTAGGRVVKRGRLIRSGALWKLTDKDIGLLASIPLKTVVDFRTEREILEKPDLAIPGVRYIHCPILPELKGVTRELGEDGIPAHFRMELDAFESVRRSYLENAYRSIEKHFGSVESCLAEALEIGPAEHAALREKYLDSEKLPEM